MSIIQGTAKSGGVASFYDYPIENSLRFDGSSYLSRTFSNTQTSNQNMTWSLWAKRSRVDDNDCMFSQKGGTTASQRDAVYFDSSTNQLLTTKYTGTTIEYLLKTSQVFRDLSAWFHFVYVLDLDNGTQSERLRLYVNGVEVTQFSAGTTKPANTTTTSYFGNNSYEAMIGQDANVSSRFFSGYLANIQFIDGQALDQYFFGEFKDNIWVPYNAFSTAGSGTATASDGDTATDSYGTNGFHLLFDSEYKLQSDVVGGNDGTNYGVTLVYDADYGDNVAKFDGSQYIAIPTSGTAYYISAWVYYDGTGTTGVINRTVHYLTWWRGFDLYLDQGKAKIFLYNASPPGNSVLESTGSLVMGWNHVYFEVTTSAHKLVLNNGAVDTNGHTISWAGSNTLHFGRRLLHSTYTSYFTGKLADVKLFSSQLSASEITSLYNKEEVTNGLIAHYPLNDDLGRTFKDFSGNGNHWQAN